MEDFQGNDKAAVGHRLVLTRMVLAKRPVDLCATMRWSQQQLSGWEHGNAFPPHYEMSKLAGRYGVSLDWVYLGNMSNMPLHLADGITKLIGVTETPADLYRSPQAQKV